MPNLSKATRVRNYLAQNSDAGPKEVAAALSKYKVTAAYVSNIKTEMKKKRGQSASEMSKMQHSNFEHLRAAGIFIKSCGGLQRAKAVLKATAEIMDLLK